ncbi:MAG: CPBP family glutamic-type intramembrane protease, partial [Geminicoccaceae bacterium]
MAKQKENLKSSHQRLASYDAQRVWASASIAALINSILMPLLFLVFVSLLLGPALDGPFQAAILESLFFLLVAASLCRASRVSGGSWRLPLGAPIDRASIRQALLFGIALFGLSMALLYVIYAPLSFIIPELIVWLFLDADPFFWFSSEKTYIAASLIKIILLIAIGPLVEEFFFRGYFLHRLIVKFGVVWAIWISS